MARSHARREGILFYNFGESQRRHDDLLDGMITAEEARRDYGEVIAARGEVDLAETARVISP
jgi:hypothetical protein